MLKTILIDDEKIIREGLKHTIEWENMGFELVGEAKDGEEAIALLQSTTPDVIVTDIRMPFIDGLELIEFIKPMLPDAYIIILSGHDEFHYAQKALQLGVYDFLLKPLNIDYFTKLLKKIKYDYTVKNSQKYPKIQPKDLKHLQNKFIETLMTSDIPMVEVTQKLIDYELTDIKSNYFATIITQIDNFQLSVADFTFDQINEIHRDYYQLIEEIVTPNDTRFLIEGSSGDSAIVISGQSEDEVSLKTGKMVHELRYSFNNNTNHSITIAYSRVSRNITSLGTTYRQAYKASNHRFVGGYNQDFAYDEVVNKVKSSPISEAFPGIGYSRTKFLSILKSKDDQAILDYTESIFRNLIDNGHNSTLYVTLFVTSIYVELLNVLNNNGLSIDDLYDDPLTLYKNLTISTNIFDIKGILIDLSIKVSNLVSTNALNSASNQINDAMRYIETNYGSADLTLQEVAQHVNMGVCYFSSVFKKESGESFISYLTKIRINEAKKLFETTHYKAYEVSYMVGYNTPTYFSTLFKKITGLSPSDYKKQ